MKENMSIEKINYKKTLQKTIDFLYANNGIVVHIQNNKVNSSKYIFK